MLKIVGDINFTDGFFDTEFGVGSSLRFGNDPFKCIERFSTDFWIGNLECVCANISNKHGLGKKQFIISPNYLQHIKHLNLYGVANNHVMQHGDRAYNEMLTYLKDNNVNYVGSTECKSIIFEHQGKKVGILAFSFRPDNFSLKPLYWNLPEIREIVVEIEKLSECDFKIAYIHWGNEFINYPYNDQKIFAHCLIDQGIDLIVGMHPHILQGYEVYRGKYIFYSLGNFVFNMAWEPTKYSVVLNVDLQTSPLISYEYIHIEKDYFPRYIEKAQVPSYLRFDKLNSLIAHNEENEIYYSHVFAKMNEYRKANYRDIASNVFRFKLWDIQMILKDFIKRKLRK
jgi:poly-gamma-glutamate biosynthesis protein